MKDGQLGFVFRHSNNRLLDYHLLLPSPLWAGGRIRPSFPFVSYEATKRVSRWHRSASTAWDFVGLLCNLYSRGWRDRYAGPCKTMPLFLSVSCPSQPLLYMVQHVADWVAPFPSSSVIPHTITASPPPPWRTWEFGAIITIMV